MVLSTSTTTIDASLEWVTVTIDPAAVGSERFFNVLVTD